MWKHFLRPNKSLMLETSANHRPAGNPLLPLLFYICMQWYAKHLCIAPIKPVEHTHEEKMGTTK